LAQFGDADATASLIHLGPTPTQVGEDTDPSSTGQFRLVKSDGQRQRRDAAGIGPGHAGLHEPRTGSP
jgi:hypothetical protein